MTNTIITTDTIDQCADDLARAEDRRLPIGPLTDRYPALSLEDAYRVQQRNIARRVQRGERVVGHKIGLTAKAMQELFGVHEPDYGHLLDSMVHDAARPLDLSELIDPQVEVEPAFVLRKPLSGTQIGIEEVLDATDHVVVCLEIIDSRVADWRIKLQDTVADNGSSARVVIGSQEVSPSNLMLQDLATELEIDGRLVEQGNTSAILGHPALGVAWLAMRINAFGGSLAAGDLVLPGTCTRSFRIAGHHHACGRIAGLGHVAIEMINAPYVSRSGG